MRALSLAPILAATVLLAACGGSNGDDPSVAEPDDAKEQAFADCMRKAGLTVKQSNDGRRTAMQIPKGISPARLQKIQRDCTRKTGGGPKRLSRAERAKALDAALKFARCMRAHGIDVPDPKADGGGISLGSPGKSGPDPESPAFQRAQKTCESLLPDGKGPRLQSKGRAGGDGGGPSTDAVVD
jgi:hypothetical protein